MAFVVLKIILFLPPIATAVIQNFIALNFAFPAIADQGVGRTGLNALHAFPAVVFRLRFRTI